MYIFSSNRSALASLPLAIVAVCLALAMMTSPALGAEFPGQPIGAEVTEGRVVLDGSTTTFTVDMTWINAHRFGESGTDLGDAQPINFLNITVPTFAHNIPSNSLSVPAGWSAQVRVQRNGQSLIVIERDVPLESAVPVENFSVSFDASIDGGSTTEVQTAEVRQGHNGNDFTLMAPRYDDALDVTYQP